MEAGSRRQDEHTIPCNCAGSCRLKARPFLMGPPPPAPRPQVAAGLAARFPRGSVRPACLPSFFLSFPLSSVIFSSKLGKESRASRKAGSPKAELHSCSFSFFPSTCQGTRVFSLHGVAATTLLRAPCADTASSPGQGAKSRAQKVPLQCVGCRSPWLLSCLSQTPGGLAPRWPQDPSCAHSLPQHRLPSLSGPAQPDLEFAPVAVSGSQKRKQDSTLAGTCGLQSEASAGRSAQGPVVVRRPEFRGPVTLSHTQPDQAAWKAIRGRERSSSASRSGPEPGHRVPPAGDAALTEGQSPEPSWPAAHPPTLGPPPTARAPERWRPPPEPREEEPSPAVTQLSCAGPSGTFRRRGEQTAAGAGPRTGAAWPS
ncbi:PREDICTED: translation initiation factor IF-2-like [Chinchilla lanigera]|uniref:translation initiation factor IF-2-like n=1 Tax=Chinchilla lanigera TaxID=34839 RepID=UPI00038EA99E|nr:PREDICTED: translation initiation factor IF-2-like [Chinchilla lanigera]